MPTRRDFLLTSLAAAATVPRPVAGAQPAGHVTGQLPDAPRIQASSFDPWVEVTADHLRHNVAEITRRLEGRPILAVIKNNGYGAGVVQVARVLERIDGIAGLAVVKLQEAIALRDAGVRAPILLMGPFEGRELDEIARRDIMPMVYRPMAGELERVARARQQAAGRARLRRHRHRPRGRAVS